mmetsp:Transcript_23219/g.58667  ORF Transcript_23219/g.58667 Transcript_23219/m.58667 type:complete len:251 (-) Transcript_23219:585-1337(-)
MLLSPETLVSGRPRISSTGGISSSSSSWSSLVFDEAPPPPPSGEDEEENAVNELPSFICGLSPPRRGSFVPTNPAERFGAAMISDGASKSCTTSLPNRGVSSSPPESFVTTSDVILLAARDMSRTTMTGTDGARASSSSRISCMCACSSSGMSTSRNALSLVSSRSSGAGAGEDAAAFWLPLPLAAFAVRPSPSAKRKGEPRLEEVKPCTPPRDGAVLDPTGAVFVLFALLLPAREEGGPAASPCSSFLL